MKMDQDDFRSDSEDELDLKNHDRLLESLVSLDSKQPVKKPTRTEPTTEISEYNLVKSITGTKGTVKLYELTKPLKAKASHVEISKHVKKTDKKTKTLEKPLEKPQADRIRRTVGYEKSKEEISRWEPVVTSHRASTYLSFPLNYDTKIEVNAKRNVEWKVKTDLDKAIEEIEKESTKVEVYEVEPEEEAPLTLQEMIERRKEMAKLRQFQSYQEMKARMQNKIKSKKYRRILRKEKVKRQVKEFESLQQTDPEAALKKLDEIEKTRAQERASLRHKSTGKWAKSQQIRAKYDKESRQVLAEQLAISKELTQKKNVESSDSEEEQENIVQEKSSTNDEGLEFNFWLTKPQLNANKVDEGSCINVTQKYVVQENKNSNKNLTSEDTSLIRNSDNCIDITQVSEKSIDENLIIKTNTKKRKRGKSTTKKDTKKVKLKGMSGEWAVDDDYLDNLANKLEDKLKDKLVKKTDKIKKSLKPKLKKSSVSISKKEKKKTPTLEIKKMVTKPIIDEALQETDDTEIPKTKNEKLDTLKGILSLTTPKENPVKGIEPNKYLKIKPVNLETDTPNLYSTNDNEENVDMRGIIAEAFEDEDIAEDFAKDKQDDIDKDTPKDIDLFLPGWGSWGGTNIKNVRKKRRFMVKVPKDLPRKDKNKGNLIVNEKTSKAIKQHLVSEVPFPFKSVKDYEASIRAPIGNTFVPETAFRRFIKPGVTTKLGTVIDPVDEDVLMRKMKKFEKIIKIKK